MRPLFLLLFALLLVTVPVYAYSPDEELLYRITFGSSDDVKILLDKGANANARSNDGNPALSVAVDRSDSEAAAMVAVLLAHGANPNAPDKAGNYPLISAAKNGQAKMVAALIDKGADFHIKTAAGTALIDIARQGGKPEVVKPIQDAIDKENAMAASLRSPERFKEIIRLYGFHSCNYQYWNYYLASRQDPDKAPEATHKIEESKATLSQLLQQIQKYYPGVATEDIQRISNDSAKAVYDDLDAMISNRNRAEHGIGHDDDAKARCEKIAASIKVDFVPANLRE